jgi:transcription factor SPN1
MSSDDEELFDYDKDSPSPRKSPQNDEADPEIPLRDEEAEQDDQDAQGPEAGEDEADAGYGGDENYGNDEVEKNRDEIGDQDAEPEEETMEIQYDKDSDGEGMDLYRDDNDEEFDDRRDSKKKRREKDRGERGEKVKKKKHREKYEEAEEDEYAEGNDGKKKKRKRKEDEADTMIVEELCREMEQAYEEDLQCFRLKRPALNKLKLLSKVETVLKKTSNQRAFIDLGNAPDIQDTGLDILAKWLAKLPNGALPSLQLRKKIIDIIFALPVTEEHLRSSEIGKTLYSMRSNPAEDPDLKKTLKDVIDKWTKLITDMANEYDQRHEDIRDRKKIEVSIDDFRQRNMSALKKSIPRMVNKRSGFDFVRKPVGVGKDNEMRGTSARQKN